MKTLLKDVVVAIVIVMAVAVIIKPTIVKESSMEPTLYENDYLLVNKKAYLLSGPERGDIIVFHSKIEAEEGMGDGNGKKLLIKRIIALPGDKVTIDDGEVYVNGKKQTEDYIADGGTSGSVSDVEIPDGKLFVMGDHREVSLDSRVDSVGYVDEDDVVGKAFVRLYPFNKIRTL